MGTGYSFLCSNCSNSYNVTLGVGFRYLFELEDLILDIRSGKYGEELQILYESTPVPAVRADHIIHYCESCAFWELGFDATLYGADNPNRFTQTPCAALRSKNLQKPIYFSNEELENEFHVIKCYHRNCPRCSKPMKKVRGKDLHELPCPNCGYRNSISSTFLWD